MYNEHKDWKYDKIEEEKQILAEYPFLRARDRSGAPDFEAEFPMMSLEIPDGWYKLFFQMCDDIKPILEKEGLLNTFYFRQVKEKYNELVCYSDGSCSFVVEEILQKYGYLAQFVCGRCGKPAEYITRGYIESMCTDCCNDFDRHEICDKINFIETYEVIGFKDNKSYKRSISVASEWNRYLEENGYA